LKLLRTRFLIIFKIMMRLTFLLFIAIEYINKLFEYLFIFAVYTHVNLLIVVLEGFLLVPLLG